MRRKIFYVFRTTGNNPIRGGSASSAEDDPEYGLDFVLGELEGPAHRGNVLGHVRRIAGAAEGRHAALHEGAVQDALGGGAGVGSRDGLQLPRAQRQLPLRSSGVSARSRVVRSGSGSQH